MNKEDIQKALSREPESTFDADHHAEWFVNGEVTREMLIRLTDEQIIEVGDNLEKRWSEDKKLDWFFFAVKD